MKKIKDPAFLFYTKDFQSGTQDMSCEEVGAYLRLLMYQHQHGHVPNDIERMMRITGVFSEEKFAKIWEMVGKKFNHLDNHLVNERLDQEAEQRASGKPKKVASATLAGLISRANLNEKQVRSIKKEFKIDDFIYTNGTLINDLNVIKSMVRGWFNDMVNHLVNNIANANANANADINEKEKGGVGEKTKTEKKELVMPWDTETFKAQWQHWKIFKKKEFRFNYKSIQSEQAALTELSNKAGGDEKTAIAIIHQSMANGWKGFFELKNRKNEQANHNTSGGASDEFRRKTAERLGLV